MPKNELKAAEVCPILRKEQVVLLEMILLDYLQTECTVILFTAVIWNLHWSGNLDTNLLMLLKPSAGICSVFTLFHVLFKAFIQRKGQSMDEPDFYRITVRGLLPEYWADRLGNLKVVEVQRKATVLEGWIPDQAALKGALDTLYQIHLPLLEIICLTRGRQDIKTSDHERVARAT